MTSSATEMTSSAPDDVTEAAGPELAAPSFERESHRGNVFLFASSATTAKNDDDDDDEDDNSPLPSQQRIQEIPFKD